VPPTAISISSEPSANAYTTAISQPNAHIVSWPLPPIPQASLFETQTSDRKLGHHISSVSENNSSLEYYETLDAYNDSGDDDYMQVSLPKSSSTSNESSEYAADNPTATGEMTAHSSSTLPKVKPRSKSLNEINSVGTPKEITESSTSIPAITEERNESPSDEIGITSVTSCTPKPPVAKARSKFLSDGPPEGGVEFSTPKSSETVHNVSPTPDPKLNTNLEENLLFLKTLERGDIIQLLEGMNLREYKDAFESTATGEEITAHSSSMLPKVKPRSKSLNEINSVGTPKEITESSTSIPAIEEERNESPSDKNGDLGVTSCTPKPPVAKARSKFLSDGPPEGGVEFSTPKSSETVHNVSPTPDPKLNTNLEENLLFLKTLERGDIIQLLEGMNLGEYKDAFEREQINGELMSSLTEQMLTDDLQVAKSLHRLRLMMIISGQTSARQFLVEVDN
jgi:Asp/Glu/hydantoin racemase